MIEVDDMIIEDVFNIDDIIEVDENMDTRNVIADWRINLENRWIIKEVWNRVEQLYIYAQIMNHQWI